MWRLRQCCHPLHQCNTHTALLSRDNLTQRCTALPLHSLRPAACLHLVGHGMTGPAHQQCVLHWSLNDRPRGCAAFQAMVWVWCKDAEPNKGELVILRQVIKHRRQSRSPTTRRRKCTLMQFVCVQTWVCINAINPYQPPHPPITPSRFTTAVYSYSTESSHTRPGSPCQMTESPGSQNRGGAARPERAAVCRRRLSQQRPPTSHRPPPASPAYHTTATETHTSPADLSAKAFAARGPTATTPQPPGVWYAVHTASVHTASAIHATQVIKHTGHETHARSCHAVCMCGMCRAVHCGPAARTLRVHPTHAGGSTSLPRFHSASQHNMAQHGTAQHSMAPRLSLKSPCGTSHKTTQSYHWPTNHHRLCRPPGAHPLPKTSQKPPRAKNRLASTCRRFSASGRPTTQTGPQPSLGRAPATHSAQVPPPPAPAHPGSTAGWNTAN